MDLKGEIRLKEGDTTIDKMPFYKEDLRLLDQDYMDEYYIKRPLLFNKKNKHGSMAILSEKLTGFLKNKF